MSKQIRRHPRLAALFVGLLFGAVLWALAPPEAEAGPHKKIKDLIADLQASVDELAMQVEDIPTNWLPHENGERFELVLPEVINGVTEYHGVKDHRTGLVWRRSHSRYPMKYVVALREALANPSTGVHGWRLPTADEFMTLTETINNRLLLTPEFPFLRRIPAELELWTQTNGGSSSFRIKVRLGSLNVPFLPNSPLTFAVAQADSGFDANYQAHIWCVMGPSGAQR